MLYCTFNTHTYTHTFIRSSAEFLRTQHRHIKIFNNIRKHTEASKFVLGNRISSVIAYKNYISSKTLRQKLTTDVNKC